RSTAMVPASLSTVVNEHSRKIHAAAIQGKEWTRACLVMDGGRMFTVSGKVVLRQERKGQDGEQGHGA
ncbi:MAG: hypothetical protein L6Q38_13255, partial [Nitrospira sp.]|nr:hypothetical protein [Nitrospira sp.]